MESPRFPGGTGPARRPRVFRAPRVPTPILIVAVVLALPVLIPYMFVQHGLSQRRLRTAARTDPCPSCGRPLGVDALRAGDVDWRAHVAELHRANPGVKLRLVRLVDAICTGCDARLSFHEPYGTFVLSES